MTRRPSSPVEPVTNSRGWVKFVMSLAELGLLDRMGRDGVAERIAKCEVSAEWPVLGSELDFDSSIDETVMQCVCVVTAKPDGNAPAQLIGRPQVDDRRTDGKRNRLGIEHDGSRRAHWRGLKPDDVRVEGARGFNVFDLNANEIGAD